MPRSRMSGRHFGMWIPRGRLLLVVCCDPNLLAVHTRKDAKPCSPCCRSRRTKFHFLHRQSVTAKINTSSQDTHLPSLPCCRSNIRRNLSRPLAQFRISNRSRRRSRNRIMQTLDGPLSECTKVRSTVMDDFANRLRCAVCRSDGALGSVLGSFGSGFDAF
jgi:hypothetical protein